VVRTAVDVAPDGVSCRLYERLDALPHFNPDDDWEPLPAAVADLRAQIAASDAVMFCTPEYAGALPGSFKNLLDWTVGGGEMYGHPVAWINASGLPTGAADAHASLRKVLGYLSAEIVEEACVHVPVPRQAVGEDGLIADPQLRDAIARSLRALAARSSRAA
jgi:chromate reductase, NAD(P)H dehydrogenase (quinone)